MAMVSRQTIGKALVATCISAGASVLIAAGTVPAFGGSYDGLGMWLSAILPIVIAFPTSGWQFHQSEKLRKAHDELRGHGMTIGDGTDAVSAEELALF